jgi:hypothetical protein
LSLCSLLTDIYSFAIMKTTMLLAAGSLLGSSSAAVHKMALKKIPLSEQLVSRHRQLARSSS